MFGYPMWICVTAASLPHLAIPRPCAARGPKIQLPLAVLPCLPVSFARSYDLFHLAPEPNLRVTRLRRRALAAPPAWCIIVTISLTGYPEAVARRDIMRMFVRVYLLALVYFTTCQAQTTTSEDKGGSSSL